MAIITNYLLFNHTYLRQLQADTSVEEEASLAAQGVREWYAFRDNTSTQTLVDSWVQPLLHILELDLKPLEVEQRGDAAPTMGDNAPQIYLLVTAWDQQTPVGLCYVTPPGADLDTTIKGKHWMAQAVLAARRLAKAGDAEDAQHAPRSTLHTPRSTPPALRWVILTNGDQWRLLDAQALRRYEAYLQVDLDELVQDPSNLSALRVFYRCFHRTAFACPPRQARGSASKGEGREGVVGLERLLAASGRATQQAEDHLKARVSHNEGIMAQLCLGLVEATGKSHFTEAERDAVYQDATYLLYRMLFILYAEARGLLPMDNPAYQAASLSRLVETVYEYNLHGMPDPQATTLWEQLKRLCGAIYESNAALGIPAYNGGLFDDADKPHLRAGHIADAYLSQALFDLAYQPAADGYHLIDYRDLSVRHLGSIYEGMIEYKLQIAEETLWARRDGKGVVRFLRTGQEGAPRRTDVEIKPGDVYFSQTPGERRATGTYYTPEYIVDYIVRQTVGRGLAERRAPLEEKLTDWIKEIVATTDEAERARMVRATDQELVRFVGEQVLTFRTCDPAMGSGHFLVNAAHHMANFVVETLHLTPWPDESVDADPAAWRRRVVERCLYGVDVSLMAVELAKLSLWLASVAEGKPLSFLDHHLRQGNSLIGAKLEDLRTVVAGTLSSRSSSRERKAQEAGQLSMFDNPDFSQHVTMATDLLARISARVVEKMDDIKAQETDFEQVRAELEPYRCLADLWTARYYGMNVNEQQLRAISKYLINGALAPLPEYQQLLDEAQEQGYKISFFHWALEFPDVFLGNRGRRLKATTKFDAVVGNPPWGANFSKPEQSYLRCLFHSTRATLDSFAIFIEQGTALLKTQGCLGYITPSGWQTAKSYGRFRELIVKTCSLNRIVNMPYNVFPDAYVDSTVLVIQKKKAMDEASNIILGDVKVLTFDRREKLIEITDSDPRSHRVDYGVWFSHELDPNGELAFLSFYGKGELSLIQRIAACSVPMGEIADIQRGITPFHIRDQKVEETYELALDGELRRYNYEFSGNRFVKYDESVAEYKPMRYFRGPRIILRELISRQFRLQAALVEEDFITNKSYQSILLQDGHYQLGYLLAILNSRLLSHYHIGGSAIALRDDFPKIVLAETRNLPVRTIRFITAADARTALFEKAVHLYGSCTAEGEQDRVIDFVEYQLSQAPKWTDVVHDLLACLAQQMMFLHKEHRRLVGEADLFHLVRRETLCLRYDEALTAGQMIHQPEDPAIVHHDIEALRLRKEKDGRWRLDVQAKLREPASGWREHQRDMDGNFARKWLPVYRLPLDEATGRFYEHAFAHLDGFDGAGKFPTGSTRTMLEKLHATQVPKFVPVDLAPLVALEAELVEVRRKIQLTDELIDQIVYRLYGLTEEEIAIVEGRR